MSFWPSHRTLVLGAAGFCGAHLCARLVELGASVVGVDKVLPETSFLRANGALEGIDFRLLDILDFEALSKLVEEGGFETIFLLAAQPIVTLSNREPLETARVNVMGTYHVLDVVRASAHKPRLVFASSGAYYGLTDTTQPIPETAPALVAGNIYAPTKAAADLAVRCYAKTFGIRAACCRWMNTYGPGDTNFTRIVPSTFQRLNAGGPALIDLTDGSNVLEMLHVRDMISAYLRVAEHIDDSGVRGEAFNFGGGVPLTLRHVVEECITAWQAVADYDGPGEPKISGPKVQSVKYLDISRAHDLLGWTPSIPLADGLRETAEWYRDYLAAHSA